MSVSNIPAEIYPSLTAGGLCLNAFLGRIPGLDVATDREAALERILGYHERARRDLGFGKMPFATARQVHGNGIAVVDETSRFPVEEVDALITRRPGVCLGIYVADCCAVYAVDMENACIGLAHSGKKGTELGVVPAMLRRMECAYGTEPENTVVHLSPCIRPPFYEVDFAAEIVRQCREMGVAEVIDPGACTAAEPDRFYSYRLEKGQTGRMLALLAIAGGG